MSEKEPVTKEKLDHSGIFDFPALYSFAHAWWKEGNFGVTEEKYEEKVSGNARDIKIEWKITRDLSDYFRAEHKIKFEITGLTEVEVEVDSSRKKMNKGKISIDITSVMVRDKDGKWETSSFNRFMRDIYNKFIIPSRINNIHETIERDAHNFKEEIKKFLELSGRR